MNQLLHSIPQDPVLTPVEDFFELRRTGIGYIEQMGSRWWTDYNLHDPGITILEALCYAITDLAYRTGWKMKDLLTLEKGEIAPDQSFFTAREILTINPLTVNDYRKLLTDIEGVRNAWVNCKQCACDAVIYVWCENNQLYWGYQKPPASSTIRFKTDIKPRGLYDVLLQLESAEVLSSIKGMTDKSAHIVSPVPLKIEGRFNDATIEILFQSWEEDIQGFINSDGFTAIVVSIKDGKGIVLDKSSFGGNWRNLYYVTYTVTTQEGVDFVFSEVPQRIIGTETAKATFDFDAFKNYLQDTSKQGVIAAYQNKLRALANTVAFVKTKLHDHRNLDEDFCHIGIIPLEEIAVCADIEVAPDADIERVQAEVWWKIDQYLNPSVPFYSLKELQNEKIAVEDIFNGPKLENGFIKTADLEKSELRKNIRTSDLINLLADIEGVISVSNLLISKYDAAGKPIKGAADGGQNKEQLSAQWSMAVTAGHQPTLNVNISRFLFYKNGLPFLPHTAEANDLLEQLRVEAVNPSLTGLPKDLPLPAGTYRNAADYYPVQYSLPMTYGAGEEGLPSHVSDQRRTQAKQLKAYLMVFEQLLLNVHTQLAHVGELFSSETSIDKSYFVSSITEELIQGSAALLNNTDTADLQQLVETKTTFETRRNRFLDHLLARFGENLGEYALVMHDQHKNKIAKEVIIGNKIEVLKNQNQLGYGRAKAFNYKQNTGVAGLQSRIEKLLGFDDKTEFFVIEHLLLRPKFPGDALFNLCIDAGCDDCGPTDPYSFRLTFVMPGWEGVFNTDLELRRFAERTIRQETPSHLLPKICWIDNDGLDYDPTDCHANERFVITKIAEILEKDPASPPNACQCAETIFLEYHTAFKQWFEKNKHQFFDKKQIFNDLVAKLNAIDITQIPCVNTFAGVDSPQIAKEVVAYFADISVRGLQFERFKSAWEDWRAENKNRDWENIDLRGGLEAILTKYLKDPKNPPAKLCECAQKMLEAFGQQFYVAMKTKIEAAETPDETLVGGLSVPPFSCTDVRFGTDPTPSVEAYLKEKYKSFVAVSLSLWRLLVLLQTLENTYPVATLHDCDDGNDDNPVRLGSTALGSN